MSAPGGTNGGAAPFLSLREEVNRGPAEEGGGRRRAAVKVAKHGNSYGRVQFPWHESCEYTHLGVHYRGLAESGNHCSHVRLLVVLLV